MKKLNKGFTLIELLVVIAVLGILAAVVLVAINPTARIQDARNSGVRSDVGQLGTALEAYFTENGGAYPQTSLTELVADDQLKQLPSLPSGRSTDCDIDAYTGAGGYVVGTNDVMVRVDLESCTVGTQAWYVYKTACGKAYETTTDPGTAATDADSTTCS